MNYVVPNPPVPVPILHRPMPHRMRYAFASTSWMPGTLDEVQDLLGHASIPSTQVYAHPTRSGSVLRWTRCPARARRPEAGGPAE